MPTAQQIPAASIPDDEPMEEASVSEMVVDDDSQGGEDLGTENDVQNEGCNTSSKNYEDDEGKNTTNNNDISNNAFPTATTKTQTEGEKGERKEEVEHHLPPPAWADVTDDKLVNYPKSALVAQSYFDIQQIRAIKPVTLLTMGIAVPNFPNVTTSSTTSSTSTLDKEEEEADDGGSIIDIAIRKGTKHQLYHPSDVLPTTTRARPYLQKEIVRRAILHNLSSFTNNSDDENTYNMTHNDLLHKGAPIMARQKDKLQPGIIMALPRPGNYKLSQCLDWLNKNPPPTKEHDFLVKCVKEWKQQVRDQIDNVQYAKTLEIEKAIKEFDNAKKEEEEGNEKPKEVEEGMKKKEDAIENEAKEADDETKKKASTAHQYIATAAAATTAAAANNEAPKIEDLIAASRARSAAKVAARRQHLSATAKTTTTSPASSTQLQAAFANHTSHLASYALAYSNMNTHSSRMQVAMNINNIQAQVINNYTSQLELLQRQLENAQNAINNQQQRETQFEIYVSKDTFKFNASHFVAYPGFRERLHGHSYRASVRLFGSHQIGRDGYVLDFGCVKVAAKDVCKKMNEYFLVPMLSEVLTITVDEDDDGEEEPSEEGKICGDCQDGKLLEKSTKKKTTKKRKRSKYPGSVHIVCEDKSTFIFPRQDCLLLPIMHSTAEELAIYLYGKILDKLDASYLHTRGVKAMEVIVSEAIGQDAIFRRAIPQVGSQNDFDVASYISKEQVPAMPCLTDTEASKKRKKTTEHEV